MKRPQLNRKLVLEQPEQIADGAGGFITVWQSLGMLWADFEARTGRETNVVGGSVARTNYRVTIRAAPDGAPSRPVAKQRFVEGARVFQIDAVTESKFGSAFLTCFVTEELAQ